MNQHTSLKPDRLMKSTIFKEYAMFIGTLQEVRSIMRFTRYTYESCDAIYDVDVRVSDNDITYHVNCGFETEPNKWHRAIMAHFNIGNGR